MSRIEIINNIKVKVLDHGRVKWGKVRSRTPQRLIVSFEREKSIYIYLLRESLGTFDTSKDNRISVYRGTLEEVL